VAPIFALVVETFIQHLHDLNEVVSTSPLLVEKIPVVEEEEKRTDCKSSAQSRSSECQRGPMDRWKWPREL
jgi:hypothetical protein